MRILIVGVIAFLLVAAAGLSYVGYAGESQSVKATKSARAGSSGGGYAYVRGRVK